jgi:hypothetical protein
MVTPLLHRASRQAELTGDFPEREQAGCPETLEAALEAVGSSDPEHCPAANLLPAAGPETTLVEDRGNFRICMVFKELVDLGYHRGPGLAHLPRIERQGESQAGGHAAAKAYRGDNLRPLAQGDILDKEPRYPFALPVGGAWLAPERGHVGGERKDACSLFFVEHGSVAFALLLVFLLSFAVCPKLAIPFSLQFIGDKAIVRVDLHVPPACQLGVVPGSFDLL